MNVWTTMEVVGITVPTLEEDILASVQVVVSAVWTGTYYLLITLNVLVSE